MLPRVPIFVRSTLIFIVSKVSRVCRNEEKGHTLRMFHFRASCANINVKIKLQISFSVLLFQFTLHFFVKFGSLISIQHKKKQREKSIIKTCRFFLLCFACHLLKNAESKFFCIDKTRYGLHEREEWKSHNLSSLKSSTILHKNEKNTRKEVKKNQIVNRKFFLSCLSRFKRREFS